MATVSIRIPDELNNTLAISAKEIERPKGYIIRKALEAYLLELQEDTEDARIALTRKKNPNRKFYTSEEMQKMLENKLNV